MSEEIPWTSPDLNQRTVETYEPNPYDAARAESDLAFIAKKRREIEWWQHNIAAAEEKIARAEERLKAFAIQYRQTVGGSQISLANGFVAISKQRERTEIYDRPAFVEWMEDQGWPNEYWDTKAVLNESKVKNALTAIENGDFYLIGEAGGQIVPGIRRVKPGPLDFHVKINAGRDHFAPDIAWDKDGRVIPTITEENDDADADAE